MTIRIIGYDWSMNEGSDIQPYCIECTLIRFAVHNRGDLPADIDAIRSDEPGAEEIWCHNCGKWINLPEAYEMTQAEFEALGDKRYTLTTNAWGASPYNSNYRFLTILSALERGIQVPERVLDEIDGVDPMSVVLYNAEKARPPLPADYVKAIRSRKDKLFASDIRFMKFNVVIGPIDEENTP